MIYYEHDPKFLEELKILFLGSTPENYLNSLHDILIIFASPGFNFIKCQNLFWGLNATFYHQMFGI